MDQRVQELLLQRPNRNEEEFFATRVLKAAGIVGGVARELHALAAGEAKKSRWGLTLKFLKRYCVDHLRLGRPFITAAAYRDPDAALEDLRMGSWDAEQYDTRVILARFPGDRLAMFSATPELNDMVGRYGLPFTAHARWEREYLIQQPLDTVLDVLREDNRYDSDSPQE